MSAGAADSTRAASGESPEPPAGQDEPDDLVALTSGAFAADGPLAQAFEGFSPRDGQTELALLVAGALAEAGTAVAEAGTGIGKTFAYLVPALLAGGKVLVSTGTRTLQDQLFGRDLPALQQALGRRVSVALLKGRANYVCRHHLARNLADGRAAGREQGEHLARIAWFARASATGDRADCATVPEDADAWALATSTRDNCLGQECPDWGECFVVRARRAAQAADVVVINHHLFCADLALRDEGVSELLPAADAVIFDEAHLLPETGSLFFGEGVSSRQLTELARDAATAGLTEAPDSADWPRLADALVRAARTARADWPVASARADADALLAAPVFHDALGALHDALETLAATLHLAAVRGAELQRVSQRAALLQSRLRAWLDPLGDMPVKAADSALDERFPAADSSPAEGMPARSRGVALQSGRPAAGALQLDFGDDHPGADPGLDRTAPAATAERTGADPPDAPDTPNMPDPPDAPDAPVRWAEAHLQSLTLHRTPISVAGPFSRQRGSTRCAWVFVSATLALGGDFTHFVRTLGLEDARCRRWDSPFDFERQALLYVPPGCGDPQHPAYTDRVVERAWPLIVANRGRAFVLCTSLRAVRRTAELLRERIADGHDGAQLTLLAQGEAPRAELLRRYREAPAPVLIGAASFWQGIDVRGDQLSLVVIDKLPFASPDDPVLQARLRALRRAGRDPFGELQLPAAAVALKQGAGRLIRSEGDRGLLMIGDERLVARGYGRRLLASLPPFPLTRDPQAALGFVSAAG